MKKYLTIIMIIAAATTLFSQGTPQGTQQGREAAKLPEGYGNARWGAAMDAVKTNIIGKITYTDDEKVIITKDEHIEYTYGFFYMDPQKIAGPETVNNNPNNQETPSGILYYVSVKFPYLPIEQVRNKLETQYGVVTIDNVSKGRGIIGWSNDKTIAIIYVNEYEGKQYAARVIYVSTETIKQVNDYETSVFNRTEIETIRGLTP